MAPNGTPTELWDTALHESGHALVAILNGAPITRWRLGELKTSRKKFQEDRDFTKVARIDEGFVTVGRFRSPYQSFLFDLAGYAATKRLFPVEMPRNPKLNISDEDNACYYVQRQFDASGARYQADVAKQIVQPSYRMLKRTFEGADFQRALTVLARYMLTHMYENRGNIRGRMLRHLSKNGIGLEKRMKMQRKLKALDPSELIAKKARGQLHAALPWSQRLLALFA